MRIFILILGWIFYIGELFKGRKIVTVVVDPPGTDKPLSVRFGESKLVIHCDKKQYRRSYDKWFIPTDKHTVYSLYCEVSEDADPSLKLACSVKVDLPALLPKCVIDDYQKVAATHAFIDIITGRLQRIKVGLPP